MRNILVPTDFSDGAMKAAVYAAETARSAGATLHLHHVVEVPERFYPEGNSHPGNTCRYEQVSRG